MKFLYLALFLAACPAFSGSKCQCKCLTKKEGKITFTLGEGKNREEAGENLKKNLENNKCEITPTCEGKCDLD